MHSATFLLVVIPIPIILFGALTASLNSFCPSYDTFRLYLKTFLACQLSIIVYRLVLTIRRSVIGYALTRGRLPELPNLNPKDKYVFPLVEELLKLVILVLSTVIASGPNTFWSHSVLVGTVFAVNKLCCNFVTFSPLHYDTRFKTFRRLYRKYGDYTQCNFHKKSISSIGSQSTKTTLVSNIQDTSDKAKEMPIFNTVSFEGQGDLALPLDIHSNNLQAHHSMIDRLYSVSPRDTLYLLYGDYELPSDEHTLLLETPISKSNYQTFRQPIDLDPICSEPHANFTEVSDCHSLLSADSTPRRERNPFHWFSWLLPLEDNVPLVTRKTRSAAIKKKLSTYTLNSDSSSSKSIRSRKLFGSFDLESQKQLGHEQVANSHTFREFAAFANKYLDFWSPNLAGILRIIDPAFIRFGVPLDQLPAILFITHILSSGLWQYVSTLLLAFPLVLKEQPLWVWTITLPSVAIVKLFCNNYLHCQCSLSYKFSIITEFLINFALAILVGFLYVSAPGEFLTIY